MKNINNWIKYISKPRDELGGMPVCPFASSSSLSIVDTDGSDVNPPTEDFDIIIYRFPEHYTIKKLNDLAKEYNVSYPEMIFLPDHKDRVTFINRVQTNNGKYNLILCQPKAKLEAARAKLKNTKYYSYWEKEYLKEILNK